MLRRRPPRRLYKYVSPELIGALEAMELRLTPPNRFNDPFEALPRVKGPNRRSVRRNLEPGEDLDELMKAATPYFQREGPANVLEAVSQVFGALCLAGARRNPLLWAHYARGHEGFAIGLDPSHEWFHKPRNPQPPVDSIQRVVYRKRRPVVSVGYAMDFSRTQLVRLARGMIFTKYWSWRYEAEWRVVRPLRDADTVTSGPDGEALHLYRLPTDAVTEVIIGARASQVTIDAITRIMRGKEWESVQLSHAHLDPRSYKLMIRPLGTA